MSKDTNIETQINEIHGRVTQTATDVAHMKGQLETQLHAPSTCPLLVKIQEAREEEQKTEKKEVRGWFRDAIMIVFGAVVAFFAGKGS